MGNEKTRDLTEGEVWKKLLLFFLPILAGGLFQQMYVTVDAVVIGRFAGKWGLAAVDSVCPLLRLPVNFMLGFSTGATIMISQYFGAKDRSRLSRAVHTGIALSLVGGVSLAILGIVFLGPLIRGLDVPEDIFPLALSYSRIYFAGLPLSMVYNMGAGILRSVGDSKGPFCFLIIAGLSNVVLDVLFVGVLGWSVSGAAAATVVSQGISAVLVMIALTRESCWCRIFLRKISFDGAALRKTVSLGLPVALQASLYPVANMTIQTSINAMGTDVIAAWSLCGKLDFLVWVVADSFAAAITTFVAQNYGASDYGRIRRGIGIGLGYSLSMTLAISAVLFLYCRPLGSFFLEAEDTGVVDLCCRLTRFLAPMYCLYALGEFLSGAIRGVGETVVPMLLTMACTCFFRVLWVLAVVPFNQTLLVVVVGYPLSWGLSSIAFVALCWLKRGKLSGFGPAESPLDALSPVGRGIK